MEEEDNIELRSEEVREILETPPGWLEKWGILVILSVVLVLLALSGFYKYPDLIAARITLLTENPPVTIFARSTGKLDHLFVADQQVVEQGQLLGIIENPARYEDMYMLVHRLDSLRPFLDDPQFLPDITLPVNLRLGQVHPYYTAWVAQLDELVTSTRYNLFEEKAVTLQNQASDLEKYLVQLTNQARILNDKRNISQRQLSRDSLLFQRKTISETDLEKSETEYLNHELNHKTALASLSTTRMQISQIRRQITEYQTQRSEQQKMLLSSAREKFENLVNQLMVWEQGYVLKTPVPGRVTFNDIWNVNQQVGEGTAVFSVVPLSEQRMIGRITLPVAGSGKVQVNQRVNIKLDNYPHLEYGILRGRITNISLVPVTTGRGGYYTAEVVLDQGLMTNYNQTLPFSQEMQGRAEIITRDRRLLERLVAPLVSLYRQRMLTY